MLQGQLQQPTLDGGQWPMQPRTDRMKNSRPTIDMSMLHQEQDDMAHPERISFDPGEWSSAYAASPAPSTPIFPTKREPRDPAELLGRHEMTRTMSAISAISAMSYDSACRSSINDGPVSDMESMVDAFQNSPGGYSAYSQTHQTAYSQATSQYDPNDGHFEYSVSLCGESLDACQAVSPMDQSIYGMQSPLMPYARSTSSSQLEGSLMFIDSQQHVELPPSPAQTAEVLQSSPKEKFKCTDSGCGKSFSRQADLQRHYDHVHPAPDSIERGHACDYPKCARQAAPFRRKDHFRDHLREFHKEDLLKRSGQEPPDWFNGRNIKPSFWRCVRCLRRINTNKHNYTCPKCNIDCEPVRVEHREKHRCATVQGPLRTSKKSRPTQRATARLAQNLASPDTLSPSAMPTTSWRGAATAPAAARNMMLFAHTSPYAEVDSPSNGIYYPEDQLSPSG
ncbi:hypothetical protein RB601_009435 [Gaeumannomyces tritici]